jgi:hypothetical protein
MGEKVAGGNTQAFGPLPAMGAGLLLLAQAGAGRVRHGPQSRRKAPKTLRGVACGRMDSRPPKSQRGAYVSRGRNRAGRPLPAIFFFSGGKYAPRFFFFLFDWQGIGDEIGRL